MSEHIFALAVWSIFGNRTSVKGAIAPQSGSALDKSPLSKLRVIKPNQRCSLHRNALLYISGKRCSDKSERVHFGVGISSRNPLTPVIVGSNGNLMFPAPGSYRKVTILAGMDPLFPYGYFFSFMCPSWKFIFRQINTHRGRNHYALFWSVYR